MLVIIMLIFLFLFSKKEKGWFFEIIPNSSAGSHSIDLAADLETLSSYQHRQLLNSSMLIKLSTIIYS